VAGGVELHDHDIVSVSTDFALNVPELLQTLVLV
jgi:hypothetical protein